MIFDAWAILHQISSPLIFSRLFQMGSKESSLKHNSGYRILQIKPNSPLQHHLQPFFDFIVDLVTEQTPKQILGKLTGDEPSKQQKPLLTRMREQEGKKVVLKVRSAKSGTLRQVEFVPDSTWSNGQDPVGITYRLEGYQNIQDNFCRITGIKPNSPISTSGIQQGEYLLGVMEFKYGSTSQLTDKFYQRLYDAEVPDKNVHLAVYNITRDEVRMAKVELRKKWGGQGILGCELNQGHLYRLPTDLSKVREDLKQKERRKQEVLAARKELLHSDGAGRLLAQVLKKKQSGQPKKKTIIRNPQKAHIIKSRLQQIDNAPPANQSLQQRVLKLEKIVQVLQKAILEDSEQP